MVSALMLWLHPPGWRQDKPIMKEALK